MVADIASSMFGLCVIPFYDTLSPESIEYILEQTRLKTVVLSRSTLEIMLSLKQEGQSGALASIILMESPTDAEKSMASGLGLILYGMAEVIGVGNQQRQSYKPPQTYD